MENHIKPFGIRRNLFFIKECFILLFKKFVEYKSNLYSSFFVFLIWFLRDLVLVMLTSIVIASFMESSVPYFEKMGVARIPGVVILYVVSFLALAGTFYLFAPLLITEIYITIGMYVVLLTSKIKFKNKLDSINTTKNIKE